MATPARADQAPVVATESHTLTVPAASGPVSDGTSDLHQVAHLPQQRTAKFSMLGVTWQTSSGGPLEVQFRASSNGHWSAWTTAEAEVDDPATGRAGTEPLYIGSSDGVEVRVLGPVGASVSGAQVTLMNPGVAATDRAPRRITPAAASGGVEAPAVITRAGWGADEDLPASNGEDCVPPKYTTGIKAVIVHHTEGSNNYTQAQAAGIVRGIYRDHVVDRGWCDIGYNALVDQYGQVFEGRRGGLDHPVHGAHAGSWNTETFGISLMMKSNTAQPSTAGLVAMTKTIAWKLANNYVEPIGTVNLAGKTINIISGHGDVMATDCPGTNLRNYLPTLSRDVEAAMAGWRTSAIHQRWLELGGTNSELGRPYVMERPVDGGRMTEFTGGAIWQTPTGSVFWAGKGAITAVNRLGMTTTGWPTADQKLLGWGPKDASVTTFEKGEVYASPSTGGHLVSGSILAWLRADQSRLRSLGLPIADAQAQPAGGVRQRFEHGVLTLDASGHATTSSGLLGDRNGDLRADLVLVDAQTNSLWWAATGPTNTGSLQSPKLGSGWGSVDWISQVPDLNGDGVGELVSRQTNGSLWLYRSSGPTSYEAGRQIGKGWGSIRSMVVMPDMDGDGAAELYAIDSQQRLLRYSFNIEGGFLTNARAVGKNWGGIRLMATVGQFVGDSTPDLLAVAANGQLIAYELDSSGHSVGATVRGTGWGGMDLIFSPGDIDGDGRRDLLGRNPGLGRLFTYLNNGSGGWTSIGAYLTSTPYRLLV